MRTLIFLSAVVALGQEPNWQWHDIGEATMEGQGWKDTRHPFDRLPAKAEKLVRPPVWSLQKHSAGIAARFVTDAGQIRLRWSVRNQALALPHMPSTGVSGLDLYTREGSGWRWVANGRPTAVTGNESTASGLKGDRREYMLYLPLYNGADKVEIAVPEKASFEKGPPRRDGVRPLVFYGTSILHGGCASRPGMAYPSITGRKLDWPIINLGFSGNGKTEPEMAALLAELDPAAYILDSLPNLSPQETADLVPPFYGVLRRAHPTTPIVLVENVAYTQAEYVENRKQSYMGKNTHLRAFYVKLIAQGEKNVYYVPADELLGADGEDTVDGTHPTDLGFMRMADTMVRVLRPVLAR